jgi:pimeloyl-ACP methyl ester carboxylesterase
MPEVIVGNRKLAYEAQPANFLSKEYSVVLIHGSGGDKEDWRGQLRAEFNKAAVIAFELPGHGSSEGPGERSVPAYSQWVEDFVQALGLKKVVLVGCSLGSAIVQWIALNSPGQWLVGIGLVGAGSRLRVHPDFLDGLIKAPETALQNLADFCLSKESPKSIHDEVNKKFAAASAEIVHGDLSACNEFDVTERIGDIATPTFIVVGKEDRLTPAKYSKFLNEMISGSTLTVLPEAGHMVMLEKPAEFNKALADFLEKTGA